MSRDLDAMASISVPAEGTTRERGDPRQVLDSAVHARRTEAEKSIAAVRVVLAGFAALALWLDPLKEAQDLAEAFVIGYLFCSLAVLVAVWRARSIDVVTRVVMQGAELLYLTALVYVTRGSASLFFTLFVFSVICASLRFGTAGTLASGAAAAAAFTGVSLLVSEADAVPLELNRFVIRVIHLLVVGVLLVGVARHQRRLSRELTSLGSWPRQVTFSLDGLMKSMLQHLAQLLRAKRIVVLWDEPEEPWSSVAEYPGGTAVERLSPDAAQRAVDPTLELVDFISHCVEGRDAVLYPYEGELRNWEGRAVGESLRGRLQYEDLASVRLTGHTFEGRMFAVGSGKLSIDDLLLARIAAVLVASRLDEFRLFQQSRDEALARDRAIVARDLHDGLLQSLTGVLLQLEILQRSESADERLRGKLSDIQGLLEQDQRQLRRFVQELRPGPERDSAEQRLESRLTDLGERMRRQWSIDLTFELSPQAGGISDALSHEIYSIVHEAVANTAKHGGASWIQVTVTTSGDGVGITVRNDGHGFPFHGRYTLAELQRLKRGPVSLKERLALLGGDMVLDSTETGSELTMRIPDIEGRRWPR